jgi:hypothetical protein
MSKKLPQENMAESVRGLVQEEVRQGTHDLRASYLSSKYNLQSPVVQRVLSDLAAEGALEAHYIVLCSGPSHNLDPDLDVTDKREIPRYPITCGTCGEQYVPDDGNVGVYFEPTKSYAKAVSQGQ